MNEQSKNVTKVDLYDEQCSCPKGREKKKTKDVMITWRVLKITAWFMRQPRRKVVLL